MKRQWLRSLLYAIAFGTAAVLNSPADTISVVVGIMFFVSGSFAAFALHEYFDD